MVNQAEIDIGSMVYDPFVGTGSILIACSEVGGYCFGSDIDMRVLKGFKVGRKSKMELPGLDYTQRFTIFTNFDYYQLPKPEIFAMDATQPSFRNDNFEKFDCIVCDPPYGVRARSKKTKKMDEVHKFLPNEEETKEQKLMEE